MAVDGDGEDRFITFPEIVEFFTTYEGHEHHLSLKSPTDLSDMGGTMFVLTRRFKADSRFRHDSVGLLAKLSLGLGGWRRGSSSQFKPSYDTLLTVGFFDDLGFSGTPSLEHSHDFILDEYWSEIYRVTAEDDPEMARIQKVSVDDIAMLRTVTRQVMTLQPTLPSGASWGSVDRIDNN